MPNFQPLLFFARPMIGGLFLQKLKSSISHVPSASIVMLIFEIFDNLSCCSVDPKVECRATLHQVSMRSSAPKMV